MGRSEVDGILLGPVVTVLRLNLNEHSFIGMLFLHEKNRPHFHVSPNISVIKYLDHGLK